MTSDPTVQRLLAEQAAQHERDRALTWEEKVAIIERLRATFPGGRWPGRGAPAGPASAPAESAH